MAGELKNPDQAHKLKNICEGFESVLRRMLIENDKLNKRLDALEYDTAMKFNIMERNLVEIPEKVSKLESGIAGSLGSFFEASGPKKLVQE